MRVVVVLSWVVLLGCGPTPRSSAPPPEAVPTVAGWPPLPELETSAVLALAELAAALPPLPIADGVAWVERVFVPWMDAREAVLHRAAALRRAARSASTQDYAVAVALHGFVLQATHDALRDAHAERIDPEAGAALRTPARALATKAREAYELCHQLALDAGVVLDGWRRTCDASLAALPND